MITYQDYSKFKKDFNSKLNANIVASGVKDYETLDKIFLELFNTQAPCKKKVVRANHKPYITKKSRKAIMKRSSLENKLILDHPSSFVYIWGKQNEPYSFK